MNGLDTFSSCHTSTVKKVSIREAHNSFLSGPSLKTANIIADDSQLNPYWGSGRCQVLFKALLTHLGDSSHWHLKQIVQLWTLFWNSDQGAVEKQDRRMLEQGLSDG